MRSLHSGALKVSNPGSWAEKSGSGAWRGGALKKPRNEPLLQESVLETNAAEGALIRALQVSAFALDRRFDIDLIDYRDSPVDTWVPHAAPPAARRVRLLLPAVQLRLRVVRALLNIHRWSCLDMDDTSLTREKLMGSSSSSVSECSAEVIFFPFFFQQTAGTSGSVPVHREGKTSAWRTELRIMSNTKDFGLVNRVYGSYSELWMKQPKFLVNKTSFSMADKYLGYLNPG